MPDNEEELANVCALFASIEDIALADFNTTPAAFD